MQQICRYVYSDLTIGFKDTDLVVTLTTKNDVRKCKTCLFNVSRRFPKLFCL